MLSDVAKDKTFNIRLGADDTERLERLSEHYALGISSVIRMLVKQAADALPPPEKPKRKK